MDGLTRKNFTTSRGLTYTYYDTEPAARSRRPSSASTLSPESAASRSNAHSRRNSRQYFVSKPTALLLHGFPDSAKLWTSMLPLLSHALPSRSFRFIVPDLLGYGDTDKPADPLQYAGKDMVGDLAQLLTDGAGVREPVIIIGHDWGSYLAQRCWLWRGRAMVAGLVLLNVAYIPPDLGDVDEEDDEYTGHYGNNGDGARRGSVTGAEAGLRSSGGFDLELTNVALEEATGYPRYAYWEPFAYEQDGQALIEANLDRFWAAMHGDGAEWMRDLFCVRGALREYLQADDDRGVRLREYAREGAGWKEDWMTRMKRNGFTGPLNWYRVYARSVNWRAERRGLTRDQLVIGVPTLYVSCSSDVICLPSFIEPPRQAGLLPDLEIRQIDAGHWCMLDKPEDVAHAVCSWLKDRFW